MKLHGLFLLAFFLLASGVSRAEVVAPPPQAGTHSSGLAPVYPSPYPYPSPTPYPYYGGYPRYSSFGFGLSIGGFGGGLGRPFIGRPCRRCCRRVSRCRVARRRCF